jgi:peptidoglycan/xylan/chitin deacetylase (PgdA/CDA1 family)
MDNGAVIRGNVEEKKIYLMFSGGDFGDGCEIILDVLNKNNIKAHFFFTGDFYRNSDYKRNIQDFIKHKHYLGAHSDKHLLYAPWDNRDSTLVSKDEFLIDLNNNYNEMEKFGIRKSDSKYFLPPYEWYNKTIAKWTEEAGLELICFTPGTRSTADYTTPDMDKRYRSSDEIYKSILNYERNSSDGLNGFYLLLHVGTHPDRTDKFYYKLNPLIEELKSRGYTFHLLNEQ